MLTYLPSELRIDLYRRVFACYATDIYVEEHENTVRLSIETSHMANAIDFTKVGLRDKLEELRALIYDLSQEYPILINVTIDGNIQIEPYIDTTDRMVITFAVNLGTMDNERWYSTDCDLCIELLEAFKEMVRLVEG